MTGPADAAVAILLALAALICLLSCIGLLVMKGFYDKLHYLAPSAILAAAAIVAAIVVHEGLSSSAIKALLVLLVMVVSNPVLTHAAARAENVRARQNQGKQH